MNATLFKQKISSQIRQQTYSLRLQPDFMIVGTQKSGTTSLFHYLLQSPDILSASKKEIRFFDNHFHKGIEWYRSHFPLNTKLPFFHHLKPRQQTFDASPSYFIHSQVAQRIHALYPDIKILILLRDPVERTLSHFFYKHPIGKTIEEVLEKEMDLIRGNEASLFSPDNRGVIPFTQLPTLYIVKSLYQLALLHWLEYFSPEQILLLKAEHLFKSPGQTLDTIFSFLGARPPHCPSFDIHNQGKPKKAVLPQLIKKLQLYFKPFTQKLYELHNLDWQ